jgi:protein-tyrosine-phosphatase/DNA-binding transcriptional ArsR family regulator
MESSAAVAALSALAQESRLEVFRELARAGDEGATPGDLAARLAIPGSTLSFHLHHLVAAGVATRVRRGRSLRYAVAARRLRDLFFFLGEDCLQGRAELCPAPAARIATRRSEALADCSRPLVLFVCSQNSARSQLAEAILRRRAGDRFEVASAGIAPRTIHPLTLEILEEHGHDVRGLEAKDLGGFLGKRAVHFAIVVCEAANAHCPGIVPFALEQLFWPFPDPAAATGDEDERRAAFAAAYTAIDLRIRRWLDEERPWRLALRLARAGATSGGSSEIPE